MKKILKMCKKIKIVSSSTFYVDNYNLKNIENIMV